MTGSGTSTALPSSINYVAIAQFSVVGFNASVQPNPVDTSQILVSNADEVLILIAIDTNYVRYDDISADPAARVAATLAGIGGKNYSALLQTHVQDHSALFGRVDISLGQFYPTLSAG